MQKYKTSRREHGANLPFFGFVDEFLNITTKERLRSWTL
jgi:hypothetical protein